MVSYLEKQANNNLILSILFFFFGILAYKISIYYIWLTLISFGISGYFFHRRLNFKSGIRGEQIVATNLSELPNSYMSINDVKIGYGNIDHIVIGENGIFVIETKNYEGTISVTGDTWIHSNRRWKNSYFLKSPSKQVKNNAVNLKSFLLERTQVPLNFKIQKMFIPGIVVLSNQFCSFTANNDKTKITIPNELNEYIQNYKSIIHLTKEDISALQKIIRRV